MKFRHISLSILFFCNISLYAQNSSFDFNADAYIHKAHIESANEKDAINKFVLQLKYYGIWENIHALYIPTGGTELSHKLNLKDPRDEDDAFRLFYPNGAEHSNNGTDWDGIDQGALTFYNANSTRLHLMVYQDEEANEAYMFSGDRNGVTDLNSFTWSALYTNGSIAFANQGSYNSGITSEQKGFFYGQRISNDSTEGYVNRSLVEKWKQPFSLAYNTDTSQKIWINKNGGNGVFLGTARYQVISIGTAMDSDLVFKYYDIVQAFLSELGIQVGEFKDWSALPNGFKSDYESNYKWVKATENATDTAIDGVHLFSINDSLYLWGGWNGNWYPFDFNTGYVSGDGGKNWSRIGQAPWNSRHAAAYGTDKNDAGYLIGSDMQPESSGINRKEVWKTTDGRNWSLQTDNAPWSDHLVDHGLAIKGDTLYIAGGQFGSTSSSGLNDTIWRSIDEGITWLPINTNANHLGGILYNNFKYFSARKKFVAFCGGIYDDDPSKRQFAEQVWTSDDCITWTREKNVPFAARQYSDMVEWDGKLWIWAGDRPAQTGNGSLNLSDLWYMDKDGQWREIGSVPVPPRHATGLTVDRKFNRLVLACGNMHTDVWYLEKIPMYLDKEIVLNDDCSFIVPNFTDSLQIEYNGQVRFTQIPEAGAVINSSPQRIYPISIVADFGNGNTQTGSFFIIEKDTTRPVFDCPANRIVYLGDSCSIIVPDLTAALNSTDCSSITARQTPVAGSILSSFNGQVLDMIITVEDADGNSSPCTATITATDTTAPVFTSLKQITRTNDTGKCNAGIIVPLPSAHDNCTSVTVAGMRSDGLDTGASFPVGTTVITWTATDANGNTSTCNQIIEVLDNEAPNLQGVSEISFCVVPNNTYSIPVLNATDNCGVGTFRYSITGATVRSGTGTDASGLFSQGISTITWTVTDVHGNESSFTTQVNVPQPVTVTIPDVFIAPQGVSANTLYLGYGPSSIQLTAIVEDGVPPHSYSWSTGGVTPSIEVSDSGDQRDYTVTVTDAIGCQSTATKKIEVVDVRCGNNLDKISVCKLDGRNLASLCVDKSEVESLLSNQSYLGICANNIMNVLNIVPAQEIKNKLLVAIMPNPASQFFTVKLAALDNKPINVRVFDGVGAKIEERKAVSPGSLVQIGQRYPAGIYFLEVTQENERALFKLIKR